MAEQYYNKQNILNLPKVETINPTDYLLVQDANSDTTTSLLQFQNFIIGLDNTTFESTITEMIDNIQDLTIKIDNLSSLLDDTISKLNTLSSYVYDELKNKVNTISVNIGTEGDFPNRDNTIAGAIVTLSGEIGRDGDFPSVNNTIVSKINH